MTTQARPAQCRPFPPTSLQGLFICLNTVAFVPPYVAFSVATDLVGYVRPAQLSAVAAAVGWLLYVLRILVSGPQWPEAPRLLPDDERALAKQVRPPPDFRLSCA